MNKKYYWIKLKTDFFDTGAIDFLMAQENGCQYIVLYQMLCLQTANNDGVMAAQIGEAIIPYDVKKIVRDTKYFDIDTVTVALELFKRLGLIYQEEDNILRISGIEEMIGSETEWAEKKRNYRQKIGQSEDNVLNNVLPNVHHIVRQEKEKEKEIDKEIDKDKEKDKEKREKIDYQLIADMYNDTCVSLPALNTLSETRKKSIKARLNTYTIEDIKQVFIKAEQSDFLKGKNNRDWSANFDWLMKDGNMAKVLDGNYDNKLKPIPIEEEDGNKIFGLE